MALDPEVFQITEREGIRLIIPARGAVGNAPWTKETVRYRSRVETLAGETVSQGFSKFFNLGTGPTFLTITVEDIIKAAEKKDAIATLKLDGSLLIRSVYNGVVMLRTRGSFGYEFLDNADEIEEFRGRYPRLFDPTRYPSYSLLFEWTSPRNIIVLKYREPGLTLIGAVAHDNALRYFNMRQLAIVAKQLEVPLVEAFPLTIEGWEKLQAELDSNSEIEGYVIRLNDCQDLVKVKCLQYLTKHGLKSTLTTAKLVDMWFQQGRPDYKDFCEKFITDFDEETFMWALGAISNLFDGIKEFNQIISHMTTKAVGRAHLSRKDAAMVGLAEYGQTKRFGAYMNLWEGKAVDPKLAKSIFLQSTKQIEIGMFQATGEVEDGTEE